MVFCLGGKESGSCVQLCYKAIVIPMLKFIRVRIGKTEKQKHFWWLISNAISFLSFSFSLADRKALFWMMSNRLQRQRQQAQPWPWPGRQAREKRGVKIYCKINTHCGFFKSSLVEPKIHLFPCLEETIWTLFGLLLGFESLWSAVNVVCLRLLSRQGGSSGCVSVGGWDRWMDGWMNVHILQTLGAKNVANRKVWCDDERRQINSAIFIFRGTFFSLWALIWITRTRMGGVWGGEAGKQTEQNLYDEQPADDNVD